MRRSAVTMCQDTRHTGLCDASLVSTRLDQESVPKRMPNRRLLKRIAPTDRPTPDQEPVLYFGTRPALFLFLCRSPPAAGGLLLFA